MRASPGGQAVLRRLLGSYTAGPQRRRIVGAPLAAGALLRAPPTAGQVRHAGRRRKSIVEEDGVEELPRFSEVAAPPHGAGEAAEPGFTLPEVPAEILDAWEKDEMAQEALGMFSSEELRSKGLMSHRDVARMLELMGCDRLTFLRMLSAESDDEDDGSDEGGGVKGKGGKGKGGKTGMKGSEDRLDFDDSDDEFDFGKGGGKKGYKGSKGKLDSFGGRDDSDDEDFGSSRGKGKGGKGGKGKGKGKGSYGF